MIWLWGLQRMCFDCELSVYSNIVYYKGLSACRSFVGVLCVCVRPVVIRVSYRLCAGCAVWLWRGWWSWGSWIRSSSLWSSLSKSRYDHRVHLQKHLTWLEVRQGHTRMQYLRILYTQYKCCIYTQSSHIQCIHKVFRPLDISHILFTFYSLILKLIQLFSPSSI